MRARFEIPQCETCKSRFKSLFAPLTPDQLQNLSLSKGCNNYKRGQVIFHKGTRPVGLYCINRGKVKVHKMRNNGREQIVRLAKEGDVLGYRALIAGENYSATATVIEDASICFIPKQLIFELIKNDNRFSLKIMNLLANDLRNSEEKITNLAQKSVRERLAEALLMLMNTYGVEDDNATLKVILTREDIASIVGTATETVIRLLSEFKNDNLVELNGKRIRILNQKKLTRTASLID